MSGRSSSRTEVLPVLVLAIVGTGACSKSSAPAGEVQPLKVAAASDLSFAFKDVGQAYEKATGQKVVFSFGATGLLEKQIAEGAPFDVFAAANVSFADDAVKAGACLGETRTIYAMGHVVLFTTKDAAFHPKTVTELADARVAKIAIANPDHAPYGRAAVAAMKSAGVYDRVKPHLVLGENISQTAQYVSTGSADVGIIALSLALAPQMKRTGTFWEIPTDSYPPINQAGLIPKSAPNPKSAEVLRDYLMSDAGRSVLSRFGFSTP